MVIIINSVSIKWLEGTIVNVKQFGTQTELDVFRSELEKKPNFKLVGVSRDVTYPEGYDCYADC